MLTSKTIELGKASEQTKEIGWGTGDGPLTPFARPGT
jgi:hypothetical protein